MSFVVLSTQRDAIQNGEPVSMSVLREFLAGALPRFWDECSDLAFRLIREADRPRLDISLFAIESARQIRLGMAMGAYRRAVAEHLGCTFVMPNPTVVAVMKLGEMLSETPCSAHLPCVIREARVAGYAVIQSMSDMLLRDPASAVVRDMDEMDLATCRDLVSICATDPYRIALEAAFDIRIAMQAKRVAVKRRDVEPNAYGRFCSIEQLIVNWPDTKIF